MARGLWQGCHDACEDDQRYSVADAFFGYDLAHPHQKHRRGGHAEDDGHGVHRLVTAQTDPGDCTLQLERVEKRPTLKDGQRHSEVMGIPVEGSTPGFSAFTRKLSELGDDRGEHLQNNRCGDVRVDTHSRDAELAQRTAAEEVQDSEYRVGFKSSFEELQINTRVRDMRQEPEGDQDAKRE